MIDQLRGGRLRTAGLATKLATEAELDGMAATWEQWAQTDGAILGMIQGEIIIRKT